MRSAIVCGTLCVGVVLAAVIGACADPNVPTDDPTNVTVSSTAEADSADLTAEEEASIDWSQLNRLSPLPAPPVDTTNKYADAPAAALLGQKLFFDKPIAGQIQY